MEKKEPFGQKVKDKFNLTEKLELFNYISSSRKKCSDIAIDREAIRKWEGRIIRSIVIEVLDPFGHFNPEELKHPKLFNAANKVHRTTSERMIRNELLFKSGDKLDTEIIIDNQQLLFNNSNFRDAAIYISDDPTDESIVDVYILVQDLWSWRFFGTISREYVGGGLVFDKFLGLPQQFIAGLNFNYDRENPVTPSINYLYKNIKGSFVDITGLWSHDWDDYTYQVRMKRGFFSHKPQWAGGMQFGWYRQQHDAFYDRSFHNRQDFWIARSFPLHVMNKDFMNVVLAGRVVRRQYTSEPEIDQDVLNWDPFVNSTQYLMGIGVASRNYAMEKNIFDFFPYRILPKGFNMHFVGGVIYNDNLLTRGYAGITANHSLMTCAGYFQEEFGASTYINRGLEQITFSLKSKYFTHRFPMKKWGFRQYVYQNFSAGMLRPESENLSLGHGDVKGLRLKDYSGSSYYSIDLESEFYSPVKFMGFQARMFVFADLGVQGSRSDIPLSRADFYHAYGAGIRLNNWKLGIPFIEIAFVYYPNINGLNNSSVELYPNFYNSKIVDRNSLYSWKALRPLN
ncbi:MAG: hypothetical protein GY751_14400 [Bacteroidetes bacterium]|nr:hypothetical protein [Bacteroidota bacterium]